MTLYVPAHFRVDDPDEIFAFIERNAFGMLVTHGPRGLDVSHLPFLPERGADGRIRLLAHVARGNGQWEALEAATDLIAIFQGPHGYMSPTHYEQHPAVPTWNYTVVHAHGRARLIDEAELHDLVLRLSALYEAPNPKPWRMAELPPEYVATMLKAIVGFEIEVERVEAKFKLSQNRPKEVERIARAVEAAGQAELAGMMRRHAPSKG
jgi:transcriptional regulator